MGTAGHVTAVGEAGEGLREFLDAAGRRIAELEQRWTRFLPGSEISWLNTSGVLDCASEDTLLLVERAVVGWRETDGLYDPTTLSALIALGYDRTFTELGDQAPAARRRPRRSPGCAGIDINYSAAVVRLAPGTTFDPGGIGKGLAGDLVTSMLRRAGASGVCVNLGGDVRVEGDAPEGRGWVVALEHPLHAGRRLASLRLRSGAVASTSRTQRTWGSPDEGRHHLIDPRTGAAATSGLAGVTVLASEGWWAEVLAKACFVAGALAGRALLERRGVSGVLVTDGGDVILAGAAHEYLL